MAGWASSTHYDMQFYGDGARDVSDEIFDAVMLKIGEYCRGAPVRAKVILVGHNLADDDTDALGIFHVGDTRYFLVMTSAFMIVIDLHFVRNDVIAEFIDTTVYL